MNNKIILIESQPTKFYREEYEGNITINNKTYYFIITYYPNRNKDIDEDIFVEHQENIWNDFTPEKVVNEIEQEIIEIFTKGR
jgi:hypothetical protein